MLVKDILFLMETVNIQKEYLIKEAGNEAAYKDLMKEINVVWDKLHVSASDKAKDKTLKTMAYFRIKGKAPLSEKIKTYIHDLAADDRLDSLDKLPINAEMKDLNKSIDEYIEAKEKQSLTPEEIAEWNRIKVIKDFGDGFKWVTKVDKMGRQETHMPNDISAKMCHHCGNSAMPKEGDTYYGLRDDKNKEHVTVILDVNKKIKESKGNYNILPNNIRQLNQYMMWFIMNNLVRGVSYDDGYASNKNYAVLAISEYEPSFLDIVLREKPYMLSNTEKLATNVNKMTNDDDKIKAIADDSEVIQYIKNPSEAVQLAAVKQDGLAIQHIKNPSEAIQLAAVEQSGNAIQHIKNPSEAIQLAAVKQSSYAIHYIENPSEAAQLAAVKQSSYAIQYIKSPSEAVKSAAVKQDGIAIYYIKNQSEAIQLAAVKQDGLAIQHIKNPSEAIQLAAVKQNGNVIQYIKNPSEAIQLAAVKQSSYAIQYIKSPSEAVKSAAVKQDGIAIYYIKNPSEAIQLAAVKQSAYAIQYIKNPSEAAKLAARVRL